MEINWNEILSNVLQAVALMVLPPLAVAVYLWLKAQAELLLAQAREWNPTVTEYVERAASFAVSAAEQAGLAELIEDKKAYALAAGQGWLEGRGIKFDLRLLDAAIEKAVREEINGE